MKSIVKNLGKVSVTPKGDYDVNQDYEILDTVNFNEETFIAKKSVPKGTPTTDKEYWMKIASGPSGTIEIIECYSDDNIGTPSVDVVLEGTPQHRIIKLYFKNIKGEKGDKGDPGINLGDVVLAQDLSTESGSENKAIAQKIVSEKFTELENIFNYIGYYSLYGEDSYIKINITDKNVNFKGRMFIVTPYGVYKNKIQIDFSSNVEKSNSFLGETEDIGAVFFLFYHNNSVYVGRFSAIREKMLEEEKPIILGVGNLLNSGANFILFGGQAFIEGNLYSYNPKAILDSISNLDATTVKKTVKVTDNLFNYNNIIKEHITDNRENVIVNPTYATTRAIKVQAGKTYVRYTKAGTISSWGAATVRVFDDSEKSQPILKSQEERISIPADAINPRLYSSLLTTEINNEEYKKYMLLESSISGDTYIPYGKTIYEDDLVYFIESLIPKNKFSDRPASGYENFFVDVDVNIATTNSDVETVLDSQNFQKDRCILALPTNYTSDGKPTRLVICGHGTGWKCTASTTIPWAGMNTQLLLDEGYAVLGCNGTPGDLDGLDQGSNGTPQCYRSILAAYKYVINKYNIATNGVLTAGLSMGTIMTAQVSCFSDIPVLAQVVFSPSFELMKSQFTLKPSVRQRMCEKFGFVGDAPSFTTQDPPSEAEKQYVLDNFDKWCGYDPVINGISGGAKETFNIWLNHSVKEDAEEKALYQDKAVIRRVPIKMFVCDDDTTASPRWADYLSTMMRNGGCYCEVRHYATGGHNAWGAGDDIEINTLLGGTKTVNGASYEGLLFLKRFDL